MAPRKLILIRHSQSQPQEVIDPPLWRLTPLGRARCLALAEALRPFRLERIYSSYEQKAMETAEITAEQLGLSVGMLEGIHEHVRLGAPLLNSTKFLMTLQAFFQHPDEPIFGSETAKQALARFSNGVFDLVARQTKCDLALVTHGTVLSLFVGAHSDWDPYRFWERLSQPALAVFELPSLTLARSTFTV